MYLQTINTVKVTYQGQGHTSRSMSNQGQHQIEVIFKERYSYAGGLHLNHMRSCVIYHLNATFSNDGKIGRFVYRSIKTLTIWVVFTTAGI